MVRALSCALQMGHFVVIFSLSVIYRVAQYLQAPTFGTVKAIKRILAYLAGTADKGLRVTGKSWDNRLADVL